MLMLAQVLYISVVALTQALTAPTVTRNPIETLPANVVGTNSQNIPEALKMWGGFVDVSQK